MKSLITLIALITLAGMTHAQPTALDSCKQNYIIAWDFVGKLRDSLKNDEKAIEKLDSINTESKAKSRFQDSLVSARDQQIEQFKNREAKMDIPPLFKWNGFYAGLSASYQFTDSIITRTTFLNGLNYAIEGTANVLVAGKVIMQGILGIPLSKAKFYIKAFVGYLLF